MSTAYPMPAWRPLRVERVVGCPGFYRVASKSTPGATYRVDLVWERCSCPDWTCRRSKEPLGRKGRRCLHILIAQAVPADEVGAATPAQSGIGRVA